MAPTQSTAHRSLYSELGDVSRRLKRLDEERQEKVTQLTNLYMLTLRQNQHCYASDDEIMRLSNEVDKTINEHRQLRERMRELINRLESGPDETDYEEKDI